MVESTMIPEPIHFHGSGDSWEDYVESLLEKKSPGPPPLAAQDAGSFQLDSPTALLTPFDAAGSSTDFDGAVAVKKEMFLLDSMDDPVHFEEYDGATKSGHADVVKQEMHSEPEVDFYDSSFGYPSSEVSTAAEPEHGPASLASLASTSDLSSTAVNMGDAELEKSPKGLRVGLGWELASQNHNAPIVAEDIPALRHLRHIDCNALCELELKEFNRQTRALKLTASEVKALRLQRRRLSNRKAARRCRENQRTTRSVERTHVQKLEARLHDARLKIAQRNQRIFELERALKKALAASSK